MERDPLTRRREAPGGMVLPRHPRVNTKKERTEDTENEKLPTSALNDDGATVKGTNESAKPSCFPGDTAATVFDVLCLGSGRVSMAM